MKFVVVVRYMADGVLSRELQDDVGVTGQGCT